MKRLNPGLQKISTIEMVIQDLEQLKTMGEDAYGEIAFKGITSLEERYGELLNNACALKQRILEERSTKRLIKLKRLAQIQLLEAGCNE